MIADGFKDMVMRYVEGVLSGEIVACKRVKQACQRHVDDLNRQSTQDFPYHFDWRHAAKVCRFYPQVLRHSIGRYAGQPFELEPWQAFAEASLFGWKRDADDLRRYRTSYETMARKNGKALALSTVLPTPDGYTTMGEVQVGDYLIGISGSPVKVTAATEVMLGEECYEIVFSTGEKVVCDANHQWLTSCRVSRVGAGQGAKLSETSKPLGYESVTTTQEIAETVRYGRRNDVNHSIRLAAPFDLEEKEFVIDPYVFGAWLGDGETAGGRITVGYDDLEMLQILRDKGCELKEHKTKNANSGIYLIKGLRARLRAVGCLGNKHVPIDYMRGSYDQRLELLRGLMDTDGYISKKSQCEFVTIKEDLAKQVCELVNSLGMKATLLTHDAKLNGRIISKKYRVCFFAFNDFVPFRLARKASRVIVRDSGNRRSRTRQIVSCKKVQSVAVRCVSVEGEMYCCTNSFIPTHNSTRVAGRSIYMAGYDHNPVIAAKLSKAFMPEPVAQVILAASKRDQADKVIYAEILRMRRKSPSVLKASTDKNKQVEFLRNSGTIETVGSDKPYDGRNPHAVNMDEIHAWKEFHREFHDTMITGEGSRDQSLVSYVTTAGSDSSHLWLEVYSYACKVVEGIVDDPTYFSAIYELDEDDDPFNEANWIKANPNLGVSVSLDYLRSQAKKAKESDVGKKRFTRYHGNRQVSSNSSAFDMELWDKCSGVLSDWSSADAIGSGVDLGGRDDFAAYAMVARWQVDETENDKGESVPVYRYEASAHAYISEKSKRRDLTKQPFAGWIYDEQLRACRYPIAQLQSDFLEESAALGCSQVAYDPANALQFSEDVAQEGIEAIRMGQNYSMFNEPIADLMEAIRDGRFTHDGSPLLRWCASNAVLVENNRKQVMFDKAESAEKIDPIVAMTMAFRICCLAPQKTTGSLFVK